MPYFGMDIRGLGDGSVGKSSTEDRWSMKVTLSSVWSCVPLILVILQQGRRSPRSWASSEQQKSHTFLHSHAHIHYICNKLKVNKR